MRIVLGGRTLPKPNTFKRIQTPTETDVVTLGGSLYTDFISRRQAWQCGWKLITEEQMQIIQDLFEEQYTDPTGAYHLLQFDAYDIYAPVKLEITDQQIKYNGALIENFSIVLKQQYAVS